MLYPLSYGAAARKCTRCRAGQLNTSVARRSRPLLGGPQAPEAEARLKLFAEQERYHPATQ
jgi:hypothetical protein